MDVTHPRSGDAKQNNQASSDAPQPGQPTPELVSREIASLDLSHIAAVMARDNSIKVSIGEPGRGSFANLETKSITLDPKHLTSEAQARFVAAHEGAHIGETPCRELVGIRTAAQKREYAGKIGFFPLLNVIEDGAINDRLCRRFPNLQPDTLASYPRIKPEEPIGFVSLPEIRGIMAITGTPPLYAQALAGLLVDWSESRHRFGFDKTLVEYQAHERQGAKVEEPKLNAFFDLVLNEARRAVSFIPEPNDPVSKSLEMGIKRFAWCENVLYPELQKLVAEDIKCLQKALSEAATESAGRLSDPEARRKAEELIAGAEDAIRVALESLKEQFEGDTPTASDVVGERTDRERQEEREQEIAAQNALMAKQLQKALLAALTPYQQEYHQIARVIEDAHNRLIDVFDPERHFKWKDGLPSGTRIKLEAAMRFELTGKGHETLWMKRIDPQYPDHDVVLIIDRSFSMASNNKSIHARRAVLFARELFQRLHVPTACVGFASAPEMFVDFDDDISEPHVQDAIMSKTHPLEEGTNDAAALAFAGSLLIERGAAHRSIAMISDAETGVPLELKQILAELAEQEIPVLHFGIGAGTADKNGLYIHSWGDLTLGEAGPRSFLQTFCREMERLAEGGLEPRDSKEIV